MSKDYPGYPEYVVITLPKQGTKTINKCFSSLGYKGEFTFDYFRGGCTTVSRLVYLVSQIEILNFTILTVTLVL